MPVGDRTAGSFLTRSANILLMRGVSETLVGRVSYLTLWPMTRREQLGLGRAGIWGELLRADDNLDGCCRLARQPTQGLDATGPARRAAPARRRPCGVAGAANSRGAVVAHPLSSSQFTVTAATAEGIPLATTKSWLGPVSMFAGTSNSVETALLPVATAMVLWSCVRQ